MTLALELAAVGAALGHLAIGTCTSRAPVRMLRLSGRLAACTAVAALAGLAATGASSMTVSLVLLALTGTVATAAIAFGSRYMSGEPRLPRFSRHLVWLVAMLTVGAGTDSIALFLVAWIGAAEMVVQLVRYDTGDPASRRAAARCRRVFLIGDALFATGVLLVVAGTGATTFSGLAVAVSAPITQTVLLNFALALVVAGVCVRCALVPGHRWLLASMSAPTPVSALLHGGFVNAGGIACLKLSPLLGAMPLAAYLLVFIAACSAVGGALVLVFRSDIKGRLAGSTVTQMSYMLVQCALGAWAHALFHLVAHALYKSHAFLRSGSSVKPLMPASTRARAWILLAPGIVFVTLDFGTSLALADVLLVTFFCSLAAEAGVVALARGLKSSRVPTAASMLALGAGVAHAGPRLLSGAAPEQHALDTALTADLMLVMTLCLSAIAFARITGRGLPAVLAARARRLAFPDSAHGISPRRHEAPR